MPTAIVEQIAAAIQTQVLTVTIANGYTLDITEVIRPGTQGIVANALSDKSVVLYQLDPREDEPKNAEKSFGGAINPDGGIWKHWIQPFALALFRLVDEADTSVAADTVLNQIRADVEKALMVDPSWAGLAYASFIRPSENFAPTEGAYAGVEALLEVSYRTLETDPYSQAP